jgi:hypothetical protein
MRTRRRTRTRKPEGGSKTQKKETKTMREERKRREREKEQERREKKEKRGKFLEWSEKSATTANQRREGVATPRRAERTQRATTKRARQGREKKLEKKSQEIAGRERGERPKTPAAESESKGAYVGWVEPLHLRLA